MELLLIKQVLALIGTGISAVTDWKTGYIYDKITYPLILLGILLTLATLNLNFIVNSLIFAGIVFGLGYILYYLGQVGGGDVKLFTALTLLLPYTVEPKLPAFFMVFLVATLINVMLTITLQGTKYLLFEKNKEIGLNKITLGLALAVLSTLYINIIFNLEILTPFGLSLVILPLVGAIFFSVFGEDMTNKTFNGKISIGKLEDGDVLAPQKITKEIKMVLGPKKVLDTSAIKKLKKQGIEKVWIYAYAPPFGPSIFIATLITVIYPNWFLLTFVI